jgi:methylenetetrahydrofolate reductase (NADPH)
MDNNPPKVSFEFFPPKDEAMEEQLWSTIARLEDLAPRFVSVTYGAGGSTRERTHRTVTRILEETSLVPAAHLTCVGATRAEIDAVVRAYGHAGVRHIVALRGDAPDDDGVYRPYPGGYGYAADLVEGLKQAGEYEISVAAYPETHPQARSREADLANLRSKFEAGATRAITQFFFDVDDFYRFMDDALAAGINGPIVPGILPVTNMKSLVRFAAGCGARLPDWLHAAFEGLDEDPETRKLIAASLAIEQCQRLQDQGFDEFHFYTLNRPELTCAICHAIGVRPNVSAQAA